MLAGAEREGSGLGQRCPNSCGDEPAGIQHVGHEGDGVDAAGRVHHIEDHAGKGRGLKGRQTGCSRDMSIQRLGGVLHLPAPR